MVKIVQTVNDFALTIHNLLRSDRDVTIGTGGFTGEGKSVFLIHLQIAYSKIAGLPWSFNNMTWERDELVKWIDGDKDNKGQMPKYSALLPDELISMFYRRNWYEDKQKSAVELLNKCRDRRLLIGGAIPDFFDLDGGFISRVRFFAYIPRGRGIAWIFEQEDNPFSKDKWNCNENKKVLRKYKNPYKSHNFLCEIPYPDLSPKDKKAYYKVRNTKRKNTEQQNKKERHEKYGKIKQHRDIVIKQLFAINPKLTNKDVADMLNNEVSPELIRCIRIGER